MFGESIDNLNVYLEYNTGDMYHLWNRHGPQANIWIKGTRSLETFSPSRLIFEGIVGEKVTGDIALDDISLIAGLCDPDVSGISFYRTELALSILVFRVRVTLTPDSATGPKTGRMIWIGTVAGTELRLQTQGRHTITPAVLKQGSTPTLKPQCKSSTGCVVLGLILCPYSGFLLKNWSILVQLPHNTPTNYIKRSRLANVLLLFLASVRPAAC